MLKALPKYMLLRPVAEATSKRTQVRTGDAFVFRPGKANYFWGRVMQQDFEFEEARGHLVYLYDVNTSGTTSVPWETLKTERLLLAPLITNTSPWALGYFQTIDRASLKPGERLSVDYFVTAQKSVVDQRGNAVAHVGLAPDALVPTAGINNAKLIDEILKERLHVPTLESVVAARVASFCVGERIAPPAPIWVNGIMLLLDEDASDKKLFAYLARAFPGLSENARQRLASVLREDAREYAPEAVAHIRSLS